MRFVHTNIVARDWRRLADFYVAVFDCAVKPPERNLSGEWLDQATGLQNAKLAGAHLILPGYGDLGPTLEIFTYADMPPGEPSMANHTGFTHIAFEVDDVAATLALALQHGAQELGRITATPIAGVGMLTFVYFRDPEGNIIEIQSWHK